MLTFWDLHRTWIGLTGNLSEAGMDYWSDQGSLSDDTRRKLAPFIIFIYKKKLCPVVQNQSE
ncbi:short-chain dehydrogenase [Moniliophthora roreri]|nr:short-chain dehydrogenase [Moniliophthora roreri]